MTKTRATLLLAAVMAVLVAGPAMAEITYTPQDPLNYDFGIGIVNPNDPYTLNSVYVSSGQGVAPGATFQFTFAAHMVSIFYNTESLHFNFIYDNSSLEVLGARPVAPAGGPPWLINNYDNFQWPNPSSGFVSVSTLFQSMGTGTTFQPMNTTSIVPFFQVTLRVKDDVQASNVNFFGITQMTLVSHTFALSLTPGQFGYFNGAIHEIPEPGSMALLGSGFAAVAGMVIRRRRRS